MNQLIILAFLFDSFPKLTKLTLNPRCMARVEARNHVEWINLYIDAALQHQNGVSEYWEKFVMRLLSGFVFLALIGFGFDAPSANAGGYANHPPAHARQGCYEQVRSPDQYRMVRERVLVHPATTREVITPARYGYVTRQVQVRAAWSERRTIPAEYRVVREQVQVSPPRSSTQIIPGQYRTVHENVLVSPARTIWERKHVPGRGKIMCQVQVPAQYRTVARQVQVSAPRRHTVVHPAQYRVVERSVLVRPARSHVVVHPAEYRHVRERVIVQEARVHHVREPAQYRIVERRVLQSRGHLVWRRAHGISPRC